MSYSTINTWKSIMNTGNHKELIHIIHDNAIFHSPVVFTPQEGKKKVIKYLSSAVEIFKEKNFHYTDNIITDNNEYNSIIHILYKCWFAAALETGQSSMHEKTFVHSYISQFVV